MSEFELQVSRKWVELASSKISLGLKHGCHTHMLDTIPSSSLLCLR